jgi:hypothetical protein
MALGHVSAYFGLSTQIPTITAVIISKKAPSNPDSHETFPFIAAQEANIKANSLTQSADQNPAWRSTNFTV